ncbi:5794_t:CDS:2 [Ambispora leptoticha]|uniref:RecQ-mediated genome instability protein 1 n=1 Tax=Ambispora leptoticha TaxID=144679 RepID=A0A9N9EWS2_9GLOM|nr:5794_t:CDS:2 [Ambispora leptoticha]
MQENVIPSFIRAQLEPRGIYLREDWLTDTIQRIRQNQPDLLVDFENNQQNQEDLLKWVYFHFLKSHLCDSSTPRLPPNVKAISNKWIADNHQGFVLEIEECLEVGTAAHRLYNIKKQTDEGYYLQGHKYVELKREEDDMNDPMISFPRAILKMTLTDGYQVVTAMEVKLMQIEQGGKFLSLSMNTPRGTKIMVHNVKVIKGILLFDSTNVKFIGGIDDEPKPLEELEEMLCKRLGIQVASLTQSNINTAITGTATIIETGGNNLTTATQNFFPPINAQATSQLENRNIQRSSLATTLADDIVLENIIGSGAPPLPYNTSTNFSSFGKAATNTTPNDSFAHSPMKINSPLRIGDAAVTANSSMRIGADTQLINSFGYYSLGNKQENSITNAANTSRTNDNINPWAPTYPNTDMSFVRPNASFVNPTSLSSSSTAKKRPIDDVSFSSPENSPKNSAINNSIVRPDNEITAEHLYGNSMSSSTANDNHASNNPNQLCKEQELIDNKNDVKKESHENNSSNNHASKPQENSFGNSMRRTTDDDYLFSIFGTKKKLLPSLSLSSETPIAVKSGVDPFEHITDVADNLPELSPVSSSSAVKQNESTLLITQTTTPKKLSKQRERVLVSSSSSSSSRGTNSSGDQDESAFSSAKKELMIKSVFEDEEDDSLPDPETLLYGKRTSQLLQQHQHPQSPITTPNDPTTNNNGSNLFLSPEESSLSIRQQNEAIN